MAIPAHRLGFTGNSERKLNLSRTKVEARNSSCTAGTNVSMNDTNISKIAKKLPITEKTTTLFSHYNQYIFV